MFGHLILSLVIALLFTVVLVGAFEWRHPRHGGVGAAILFVFLVLFLVTWGVGAWVTPFGPRLLETAWLPFLLVGVGVSLILLALGAPPSGMGSSAEGVRESTESSLATIVFGVFFWGLILGLLAAIVIRYAAVVPKRRPAWKHQEERKGHHVERHKLRIRAQRHHPNEVHRRGRGHLAAAVLGRRTARHGGVRPDLR